jgi:outer membrane protein OmpA-like peptidoglycan-associated protein
MNNIYYDYDDDKILPDAESDLNNLYDLMQKYPEMVIELSSHTDSRGDDAYNEDLSQRRAENAKKWLVEKGVDANRIVAKGYGETQILNDCTNNVECSEEEHRRNRRTEFKIIEGPETIEIQKEVIKGTNKTPKGKLKLEEEG